MKKVALLLAFVLMLGQYSFAAEKIGTVDLQKVMDQYSKAKAANTWVQNQEKSIQTFIDDARAKVNAAPDKEKKVLEEKYNKQLADKVNAFRKNQAVKIKAISDDVEVALKAVAGEGGYTLLLPVYATLYSTDDVTAKVISKLNAKK